MYSDPNSNADCETTTRRASAEGSGRLPLFCDEAETKRILQEEQCPCPDYGNRIDQAGAESHQVRSTGGPKGPGVKRATVSATGYGSPTRQGQGQGQGQGQRGQQQQQQQSQQQQQTKYRAQDDSELSSGIDYLKPRKVPSPHATHQPRTNKAYDLRYEYTRKGASMPSRAQKHLDEFHKLPFQRFWQRRQCFEHVQDRIQPQVRREYRGRGKPTGAPSTPRPSRTYRHGFSPRRTPGEGGTRGTSGTSRSPRDSPGSRYTSAGSGSTSTSSSGSTRSRGGYATGGGGSGYTTGGGSGSPAGTRTYGSTRTGSTGGSSQVTRGTSPQKGYSSTRYGGGSTSKSVYLPSMWW